MFDVEDEEARGADGAALCDTVPARCAGGPDAGVTTVTPVRFEYGEPRIGIGTGSPRLSWRITDADEGWRFDACEIECVRDGTTESVIVASGEQVFVPWPFAPLRSRECARVRVRVATGESWTPFSEPSSIEAGLLEQEAWVARWISPIGLGGMDDGAPWLFRDVELERKPVKARLYVSARGLYEFTINGIRVGDEVLTPGWTAYEHRVRYQTYDVAELMQVGRVRLGALLGNGWFRGQLVAPGNRSSYGDRLALIAQLELTFADGSTQTVSTDEAWRAAESPIMFDDFYDGQRTDLRRSLDGLGAGGVDVVACDARLVAPRGPGIRVTETVPAQRILTTPSGRTVVDFGQNLVGWVRVKVGDGRAGQRVVIRHAEVLEHGEVGVRPLRSAKATSEYILSGGSCEVLQPTFTFNGFRYAEVEGLPDLQSGDVDALVIGSGLERTGWFESSHPGVNRLHENIVWSMRGNFVGVPTDCPQRDERLGWTGDIQVFAPTASFLFDTAGFLSDWLCDLASEQKDDGGVPYVIPDVLRDPDPAAAGWSDAATLVPEAVYRATGDVGVLARQYRSMCAWADKVLALSGSSGLWDTGFQFGDWLDPTAPPEDAARAQAAPGVVATAYAVRTLGAVADAAEVLGERGDAANYRAHERRVREAFARAYVGPEGRLVSDCQTVYALALCGDLLGTEAQRAGAGSRLAELVIAADATVSTGFLGTPLILDALTMSGHADLAYAMLLQTKCPSWLYAVSMGATTVWERWDSMLPDGTINPGSMTSFNHYAYGAVADWLHRAIGGITALEPGYRRIRVRPEVGSGRSLTYARARHASPYGDIDVSWRIDDDRFALEIDVPYGVTAEVWMPEAGGTWVVQHGKHEFRRTLGG